MKKIWNKMIQNITGIVELLKGEKSFYKYTKQTILHILYSLFIACSVISIILLVLYINTASDKADFIKVLVIISGGLSVGIVLLILLVYIYFILFKKDITPLQSEEHQIIKEMLTKVEGDSEVGMNVIDVMKALQGENKDKLQDKKQNGK
ncbi:MAG TPA: hypothetical protein VK705_05640 [Ferruginibacter sp.]|jgi:hypothetical protein|nr:hypothetical protein [Ferruginibacter sp.]